MTRERNLSVVDLLAGIGGFGESLWGYLLPFLFVLTVVVFFHELGHFLVARLCGVKVETFSIGFGKEIFGWNDRRGTRWKVSWIPLGGYVKFLGDESAASTPDRHRLAQIPPEQRGGLFYFKPVYQRAAVVVAGPLANFVLAIVIFAGLYTVVGQVIVKPVIKTVVENSAAAEAGFQPGDRVLSIDGKTIDSFEDMKRIVSISSDVKLTFVVERGEADVTLIATPRRQEVKDPFGNVQRMGILGLVPDASEANWHVTRTDPVTSLGLGVKETWFLVSQTFTYIGRVVSGAEDASQIGGPLTIARVSGQVASVGFSALLNLTAILSVSIGLLNLFPVPMLDGGHLLYYAVEVLRGRPLGEQAQEFGFRIGLALVMMLMVFATWNDLVHLFS